MLYLNCNVVTNVALFDHILVSNLNIMFQFHYASSVKTVLSFFLLKKKSKTMSGRLYQGLFGNQLTGYNASYRTKSDNMSVQMQEAF